MNPTPNTQHPTPNTNTQHPTPNTQHQHPTPNTQHPTPNYFPTADFGFRRHIELQLVPGILDFDLDPVDQFDALLGSLDLLGVNSASEEMKTIRPGRSCRERNRWSLEPGAEFDPAQILFVDVGAQPGPVRFTDSQISGSRGENFPCFGGLDQDNAVDGDIDTASASCASTTDTCARACSA